MKYQVTYGKSVHDKAEIKAVNRVLRTSTAMGKNVNLLEKKISKFFAKKYSLMVNSGSSALLLLSEIIDLKRGDQFITPIVTFPATITPFIKKGLIPKFVDVDIDTLQINLEKLEKAITSKTKAIIVPNLIGNLPRWDKIKKIINRKKIILVEDSADTLGAKVLGKASGFYSHYSITSFYGSHIVNCAGNGGCLSLNSKDEYIKAKIIRSWGRLSSITNENDLKKRFNYKLGKFEYDRKFVFNYMGYNIEPSEIGAAFGLEQVKKLKKNISIRNKNFKLHNIFFSNFKKYFILPKIDKRVYTGLLAYPLIVREDSPFTRKKLQLFLEKNGIQTRPIFTGNILRQPAFKKIKHVKAERFFRNADKITEGGLLIGLHHGINNKQIKFMYKIFKRFLNYYS